MPALRSVSRTTRRSNRPNKAKAAQEALRGPSAAARICYNLQHANNDRRQEDKRGDHRDCREAIRASHRKNSSVSTQFLARAFLRITVSLNEI
jgi:hypothetical protein